MEKRVINPWSWQERFGFQQANEVVGAERVLYCAGQTSVDDEGQPLHEGDMERQALQAVDNLETVLREADFELADIVRLTIYVVDVDAYRQAAPAVGRRLGEAACATPPPCSEFRDWRFPSCSWRSRQPPSGRAALSRGERGPRPGRS